MPAMASQNRKFLVFSLLDVRYALDLEQVAEVGDSPRIWPIPLAPACYSGALNFHGDIVAVMNLAFFLGRDGCGHSGKVIILHRDIASLAFLVDAVVKIVSEYEVSFNHHPDSGFTLGMLGLSDGEAILLDLDALVHEAEIDMQRDR